MKMYCVMHSSNYSDSDIVDLIEPSNIVHHFSEATRWEPGEDYIDCDISLHDDFHKVVKIVEFYFYDKNEENPFAVVIDDETYCLGEKEGWEDILNSLGWTFFKDYDFDLQSVKEEAEDDLEYWIDGVANEKAWQYIEIKEY